MHEKDLITRPTWERYTVLAQCILQMSVRERRDVFRLVKTIDRPLEAFFPRYGFTFSEFAVWYVAGEARRSKTAATATAATAAP